MKKRYSIAEARDKLPALVHEAEAGAEIELTRRGEPVAVVLSMDEYRRLKPPAGSFAEALLEFRRTADLEEIWREGDPFKDVRDRSPDGGRTFSW